MVEKYLTLAQNVCADRIFLNTFGLYLQDTSYIDEFSKIKIFDISMNEVGILFFNNGKIIMYANYNGNKLEANFDLAKMFGFTDIECKNTLFAEWFGKWSSIINFKIQKENDIKLLGEFLIESSADSKFGISCLCHPLIKCEMPDKDEIVLKILRDGRFFGVNINSKNYNEAIDLMPFDSLNGFIKHVISKGKYDSKRYQYEYRKFMGIFDAGKSNEDKLHVFLSETNWDKKISSRNEWPLKNGDDSSKSLLIQKGMLMHDLDPDMFFKIKELRELLLFGDISLLDNLISVCYDSYTDEEISALLGIYRQKMIYQNGADNLVNSYFGIEKNNAYFPLEFKKILLKK